MFGSGIRIVMDGRCGRVTRGRCSRDCFARTRTRWRTPGLAGAGVGAGAKVGVGAGAGAGADGRGSLLSGSPPEPLLAVVEPRVALAGGSSISFLAALLGSAVWGCCCCCAAAAAAAFSAFLLLFRSRAALSEASSTAVDLYTGTGI